MLSLLKQLFTGSTGVPDEVLRDPNLMIVDVRSAGEFSSGHIDGAVNIPVNSIPHQLKKFKTKGPIVLCCASGARSGMATQTLQRNGIQNVYNGGGWYGLQKHLDKLK